ncbi:hypothetical protein A2U01_0104191, partial [Trifolium medium]|nr:hypothetical protein [Trifolium medium]
MSEFCAGVMSSARCARDSCALRWLADQGWEKPLADARRVG